MVFLDYPDIDLDPHPSTEHLWHSILVLHELLLVRNAKSDHNGDDQIRLLKRVMRALDIDEQKWPARQAAWFINSQKDEGKRAHEVPGGDDLFQITHKRIYDNYEELCDTAGLVDFAELLLKRYAKKLQQFLKLPEDTKRFLCFFKTLPAVWIRGGRKIH